MEEASCHGGLDCWSVHHTGGFHQMLAGVAGTRCNPPTKLGFRPLAGSLLFWVFGSWFMGFFMLVMVSNFDVFVHGQP